MNEPRTRASEITSAKGAYRRLGIFLTMDFGTIVLFRHNFHTKRQTCIWADGPSIGQMRAQADTYLGKIVGLDLTDVDWARSEVLLQAVNRPRSHRDLFDTSAGPYR
ncbi:MAG TPA: hypothetical protein VM677_16855 [Actinokineospora sp.]|nr:hypothetical protein [Actinokineospora sp.]